MEEVEISDEAVMLLVGTVGFLSLLLLLLLLLAFVDGAPQELDRETQLTSNWLQKLSDENHFKSLENKRFDSVRWR